MSNKKTRLVWTQDLHLVNANWKHRPHLRGDAYHSFNQIVDYTLELARSDEFDVSVVIGGDIFNVTRPKSVDAAAFAAAAKRLYATSDVDPIKIYFIQGQHDRSKPPWAEVLAPNAVHINKAVVQLGPFSIYGLDYVHPGCLKDEMAEVPTSANMLVIHQTLTSVVSWGGDMETAIFPKHIRMVLAGDYHKSYEEKYPTGVAMSAGNIHMRTIDEDPDKFFFDVSEEGVRKVPLETRRVDRWELNCENDLEQFLAHARDYKPSNDVPSVISVPIWDVRVNDLEMEPRIMAAVEDKAFLFMAYVAKQKEKMERPVIQSSTLTLDNAVAGRADPKEDPELYGFVKDLMERADGVGVDDRLDEEENERGLVMDKGRYE